MPFQFIDYAVQDHVAQLTLNRPERLNALHADTLHEINAAMDQAEADTDVRVVVVSGAGCVSPDRAARRSPIRRSTAAREMRRWPPAVFHAGNTPLSTHNCTVRSATPKCSAASRVDRTSSLVEFLRITLAGVPAFGALD